MSTNQKVRQVMGIKGLWCRAATLRGFGVYQFTCPVLSLGTFLWGALVGIFLLGVAFSPPASAQTLDSEIKRLLDDDCDVSNGIAGGGSGAFGGTPLSAICTGSPAGDATGASSGGGTGSSQTLGVTVENRRKEVLEGEEQKQSEGSSLGATFNLGKGVSFFVSGNFEALDRDVTTFADGFDSTILGATVGGDYRLNDRAIAGAAFNYTNTDGDFDGGGNFNTDSYGIILYGSFLPAPGFFVDVAGGYAYNDYDVTRVASYVEASGGVPTGASVSGTPSSDTHGNVFSGRVLVGYDHPVGRMTIGPRAGVNYTNTYINGYAEAGSSGLELVYSDQSVNSLQSVLGLQGSTAISTPYGVWAPQANVDYIHEFANSQRFIETFFAVDTRTAAPFKFKWQTEKPVRNFFNLGIGTVLILPNGFQPFVNFRAMVGNEQFNNYAGTIGIRIEG